MTPDEFPPHLPIGTRVRHAGRQWTSHPFATVVGVSFLSNGLTPPTWRIEYQVELDEGDEWVHSGVRRHWWAADRTREGSS